MDSRERIVRLADRLQRTRGYTGWSFADVAADVGLRKASLHHHFATKGDLLEAVVRLHTDEGRRTVEALAALSPGDQIRAFFAGYGALLEQDLLCPCGALTVDQPGVPASVRPAIDGYVAALRSWFTQVLAAGRALGQVRATGTPEDQAALVLAALQGALQQARAARDPARLTTVLNQLSALVLEDP